MVFVNTDEKDRSLGAAFQQNSLQRVKTGDEAEVAFDAVPGRVFKGKVRLVIDAIAAGQLQASGALVDFGERTAGGRALAVIDIEDDMSGYQIPLGAAAGRDLYPLLAPRSDDPQDPAAHAQLAETHLPRGALRSFETSPLMQVDAVRMHGERNSRRSAGDDRGLVDRRRPSDLGGRFPWLRPAQARRAPPGARGWC